MSNLKKILALVLALVMSLSLVTIASAYKDDADVSDTYEVAVKVLTELGVFEGEGGSFYPQRNITRAETAAILYRIVTGDVTDAQAHIYSDYMKFTDTYASMWYAGYIGFCSNAELIKGYGGGLFGPQDNVTGYQALAMILRAIGYGQNGEFQGTGWEVRVASTAKEIGLLENIKESTLGKAATREMVAEMLFQGILVKQVTYNAISKSYVTLSNAQSIGYETFGLSYGPTDVINEWGQPSKRWYHNKTEKLIDFPYEAAASYTTEVKICDVADDTGLTGLFTTYTNGYKVVNGQNITDKATGASIGAQGRQTYVYSTDQFGKIIVYIDTFLAQVVDVLDAQYDAKGHLAQDATLVIDIYDDATPTRVHLTNGSTNYTYGAGEMLLVNAYTKNGGNDVISGAGQYVEIVGAAESFVGAQTTIHFNADYHTIDGKNYNDAFKYFRDDAGVSEDYNFNWWLDQFGNVIGSTAITTNYAVLKDIIWITGRPGHAEATLIDMSGSEYTVTVNSIDGFHFDTSNDNSDYWVPALNDTTPVLRDAAVWAFGQVSTDSSRNGAYDGYAMYRVDTNSDGSVNLEGWERYGSDITGATMFEIGYADNVTLDINASAIRDGATTAVTHVDSATKFIVNNMDGTYSAYTGTAGLARFNRRTVEVFYDDVDGNNVADYVYIKSFSSVFGTYVFATSDAHSISTGTWGVSIEGVYVDGVETTIVADDWDIAHELLDNKGKLYFATWEIDHDDDDYGQLIDITLVNETRDNDRQVWNDRWANYLHCDEIDWNMLTYSNGTLVVNSNLSYNVSSTVEVLYYDDASVRTLAGLIKEMRDHNRGQHADGTTHNDYYGIWVVSDRFGQVDTIYVGTVLECENRISVAADASEITVTGPSATASSTWTAKIIDKNNDGKVDLKVDMLAESDYAYYTVQNAGGNYINADGDAVDTNEIRLTEPVILENVGQDDTFTVTVYTECADNDNHFNPTGVIYNCTAKEWTINVTGWDIVTNAITYIRNGMDNAELAKGLTAYYDFNQAVANANVVELDNDNRYTNAVFFIDTVNVENGSAKLVRFTDQAPTVTGFEAATGNTVTFSSGKSTEYQIDDLTLGTIVVIELDGRDPNSDYGTDGNSLYFAFRVDNTNA